MERFERQFNQSPKLPKKLDQTTKSKIGRIESDLESALLRTMQDVIPNFTPDSLLPWVNRRIKEKAPKFGINPENIALNEEAVR